MLKQKNQFAIEKEARQIQMKKTNEVIIQLLDFPRQSSIKRKKSGWIMQNIQLKANSAKLNIPFGLLLILGLTFLLSRFLPKT